MKKLLFCLLIFPFSLSAQINESDSLNWQANLSLSSFWQGGNVETLIYRANSDVSIKPLKGLVFKTQNSYVYQEFGKVKADEDILSLNFLYLNPDRKIYPQLLGFVSTSFRREIDFRYLLGVGFTYQVLNKENNWLKFSVTSEYEHTEFSRGVFNRSQYNGDPSINTIRGTIWINGRYQILEDKLILNHESYFQPSLQESNNYRWQADIGIELPVWKYINVTMNYLHTFENVVIENQKTEDRFITFGLSFKSF